MRVEQEKCSLNTRIEELASENLQVHYLPFSFLPSSHTLSEGSGCFRSFLSTSSTKLRSIRTIYDWTYSFVESSTGLQICTTRYS